MDGQQLDLAINPTVRTVADLPPPVEGPAAWRGADMAQSEEWLERLSDADCAELDNGDLCDGVLVCVAGQCEIEAGSVVECEEDPSLGPCRANACDPSLGAHALALCHLARQPAATQYDFAQTACMSKCTNAL